MVINIKEIINLIKTHSFYYQSYMVNYKRVFKLTINEKSYSSSSPAKPFIKALEHMNSKKRLLTLNELLTMPFDKIDESAKYFYNHSLMNEPDYITGAELKSYILCADKKNLKIGR